VLRIKYERISRNLSQHQMAAFLGLQQPQVSLIETGLLTPTPEQLQRISMALRVRADLLLREVVPADEVPEAAHG
jgi:transcriptional regulator with XRE-family HTH domain